MSLEVAQFEAPLSPETSARSPDFVESASIADVLGERVGVA